MPELSRFLGIVIRMYFREHGRPHVHAIYGEFEAILDIGSGEVIAGKLPRRVLVLIQEWYALHRTQLLNNWARARRSEPLEKIAPLE